MKKIVSILAVIAMLLTFAACGNTQEAPKEEVKETQAAAAEVETPKADEPKKVYFLGPMIGGSAWGVCQTGFEERCAELGFDGKYLGPVTGGNVAEMVDLCETAVSNGADAIIGNWRDDSAFNDVIDRALANGAVIMGVNYALEGRSESYLGIDPVALGTTQAEVLCEKMEGKEIKCIYMIPMLTSSSHLVNYEAFKTRLAELRPDAEVVALDEDTGNATVAYEKVSGLLTAHPEITAIVCDTGISAVAAATLIEERQLHDDLYLQGMDDGTDLLIYLETAACDATIVQDWYNVGASAADLAKTLMEGGEIETFTGLGAFPLYPEELAAYCESKGIDLG